MARSRIAGFALGMAAATALAGCMTAPSSLSATPWRTVATATLRNAAGYPVGAVELRNRQESWQLAIGISGQAPGERAIHLHQVGACDAPDFSTAKGHLNPAGKAHGFGNPAGMHLGDLPNLVISDDGTGSTSIVLPDALDLNHIFDGDGTAVVVHGGPDDYRTDPAGNSGPRVACGVLTSAT